MKKLTLVPLAIAGIVLTIFSTGCSKKAHPNMMPHQQDQGQPTAKAMADPSLVPFTKLKRQQLENNNIDLRQVQFYVDQQIILRRMMGGEKEVVKGGTVMREDNHSSNELVIPAMTPVVCERVSGDSLMISFEAPNKDIPFGAIYGATTYSVLGTNWINGSADVEYDGQTYRIICGSCSNVAEVKLMIKETNINKPMNANKTVAGRKLGR